MPATAESYLHARPDTSSGLKFWMRASSVDTRAPLKLRCIMAKDTNPLEPFADAMYRLLAEKIEHHAEGLDEEEEYLALSEAIEAYEHARWPGGKLRKK